MKQARNTFLAAAFLLALAFTTGCSDPNRVFDQSTPIVNRNWSYISTIKYNVKIDDEKAAYNLYFNTRVSGDYKYANMFILLHTSGPQLKTSVMRYELHLANQAGEWLGSGSGNLYSYQIPFKNIHFPAKGIYHFEIEQNMRDNPLHEVSDMGMRVEKGSPPTP
jgi:gliding motility-associated lipoprotein GldH